MSFADNLRDELAYNDIKIKEFSYMTDIPYPTMLSYVNNKQSLPNVEMGVRIAKALNVSVEYLVTGENPDCSDRIKDLYTILDKIADDLKKLLASIPGQG